MKAMVFERQVGMNGSLYIAPLKGCSVKVVVTCDEFSSKSDFEKLAASNRAGAQFSIVDI